MTRRSFVATALPLSALSAASPHWKLCLFSKHLHWAEWDRMASFAAECGFDGIDLTVRPGGHVEPARATADLPRAAAAIRRAGLELSMVTTAISGTESPHAEAILATAAGLGVKHYRWGGLRYRDDRPLPPQIEEFKPKAARLARWNERYGIAGMYHTHSGAEFGASIWDLWELLRAENPRWIGINYDVAHATIEGGLGGWVRSFQIARAFILGVALKDFVWGRVATGEWRPQWRQAGEGMVDFRRFFGMLREARFDGPIQIHYEHSGLGGAAEGRRSLEIPEGELMAKFKRDLAFYRNASREAVKS